MGRKQFVILALLAVVLVGAVVWYVADQGADAGEPGRKAPHISMDQRWAALAQRGLQEAPAFPVWPFSAFRGHGAAMPVAQREAALRTLGEPQSLGLNFDHARSAMTPAQVRIWLVRGKGVTCVFKGGTVAAACDTTANTERNGLPLEVYKPGPPPKRRPTHFLALGIVPDGVKRLRVKVGARTSAVPAKNNTYGLRAEVPIRIQSLIR